MGVLRKSSHDLPNHDTKGKSMKRKSTYQVTLRHAQTGQQHQRKIIADDPSTAQKRAIERARVGVGKTMVERTYDQYDVVSCELEKQS